MAAPAEVTEITPQNESATTLRTVVELVRRIMCADVTSIVSFSLAEKTITWRAASGFRAHVVDEHHPLVRSLTNELANRAIAANKTHTLEGIGVNPELPASDFPVHAAEGVRDLAFTPLRAHGEILGALVAGYRTPHHFTDEDERLLEDLAQMAAIALENARLGETVSTAKKIWEQTFDAVGEGILVFDQDRRIIRCNTPAAEMIEMQREDVVGLVFDDAFARLVGEVRASFYLLQHRGRRSEFEAKTRAGRRYLISISSLERAGAGTVSVASWNDVTRLSDVQEQLARSRRLGSVGQLAAGVAHEINNPLAAIATCAEAIMRDLRRTESLQALAGKHQWSYYLEEIVRQALRCKDITRGLLDLTQQRQAKRVLCDLNTIARQCAKVAVQGSSSTIEVEVSLDENIGEVATDPSMVRQVLDNLLSNAVDALDEKGGKIMIATGLEGERAVIDVADDGPGIPAALVARIFDPFVSTKGSKGYGLGLAICTALAEALGASLTVESKEGEGSRFRLWIPRRAPEK